ncbi:probable bifunctional dTTP/UTP pyrophosphatase/methyltransferase protein, partial [Fukomys damarensis]|uniref:probable bifunctional dTTP/UTP pyrophosphatase/methyltransferase protein n=1 Tax=Fukomys damarensis TaxID=885580 RepID=UPI0008FF5293
MREWLMCYYGYELRSSVSLAYAGLSFRCSPRRLPVQACGKRARGCSLPACTQIPHAFLPLQGLRFEVVPSRFKEKLSKSSFPSPYAYAMETAKQKALEVATRLHQKDLRIPDMVIGADTIVVSPPPPGFRTYRSRGPDVQDRAVCVPAVGRLLVQGLVSEKCVFCCAWWRTPVILALRRLRQERHCELRASLREPDRIQGSCLLTDFGASLELEAQLCRCQERRRPVTFLWISVLTDGELETEVSEFYEETQVKFSELSEELLWEYIHSGEPMDTQPASPAGLLQLVHGFEVFPGSGEQARLGREAGRLLVQWQPVCTRGGIASCPGTGREKTQTQSRSKSSRQSERAVPRSQLWAETAGCPLLIPRLITALSQPRQPQLQLLRAVHGLAQLTAHEVARAMDLSRFTSACHLGGGTGALAHELAREYPGLQVTVFDLPDVIEHASLFRPHGAERAHVSFVPGDILRDPLPAAELYILAPLPPAQPGHTSHGLLQRVAAACRPGCGLLVADAFCTEEEEEEAAEELEEEEEAEEEAAAGRARAGLARVLDQLLWPQA